NLSSFSFAFVSFLFLCFRGHRDLHSFPTRRSSDLGNFASFAVVAVVFVAMLGVGVAEYAGMMGALIRRLVSVAPRGLIAFILILDRKSTRLNSSHVKISYAVFCLKKKN